jgi:uncharacterized protein YggE
MKDDPFLHVSEQAWGDIKPRAAFIHLTLTADKLFSGRAAFEKAVELRRLMMALAERNIPDSAVALQGATLDVSTGLFTRSSSVTYRVRIHITNVDHLAEALDAIAEARQARLTHIEWDYASSSTDNLLADCATRAIAKAKRLAASLGLTLAGIHNVHEEVLGETYEAQASLGARGGPYGVARMRTSVGAELAGLDLAPTKKIGVRVRVAYALVP